MKNDVLDPCGGGCGILANDGADEGSHDDTSDKTCGGCGHEHKKDGGGCDCGCK